MSWSSDKRWLVTIDGRQWCGAYHTRQNAVQGAMLADENAERNWNTEARAQITVSRIIGVDAGAKRVHRCG